MLSKVTFSECGLEKKRSVVVGVSGGPDSLCLLHILHRLGYLVIAAHVNHELRPEADQEADMVKEFAESLGVPFYGTNIDVKGFASTKKISIEESARILRYHFLFKTAHENNAQAVAVAHQADDQVETVLMHVLRGSGAAGVKGMAYRSFLQDFSETIPIVRPLLGIWRKEIMAYCEQNNIHPCYDQTNTDPNYFRNRIRQQLIPEISTYNLQASEHLWQLAHITEKEDNYLQIVTGEFSKKVILKRGGEFIILDKAQFNNLDLAIQRRIMRVVLQELRKNLRDIGFEPVERAIQFLGQLDPHGDWQLLEGVEITSLDHDRALVCTKNAQFHDLWPLLKDKKEVPLIYPGNTWINAHWEIVASVENECRELGDTEDYIVKFDLDFLPPELRLGTWLAGERFIPFGMGKRSIKLGDYFTNTGLSRKARGGWPLLRAGNKIIWVVGLRRAEIAPVSEATRRVLRLQLICVQ